MVCCNYNYLRHIKLQQKICFDMSSLCTQIQRYGNKFKTYTETERKKPLNDVNKNSNINRAFKVLQCLRMNAKKIYKKYLITRFTHARSTHCNILVQFTTSLFYCVFVVDSTAMILCAWIQNGEMRVK